MPKATNKKLDLMAPHHKGKHRRGSAIRGSGGFLCLCLLIGAMFHLDPALCDERILIDNYADGPADHWEEKSFKGNNTYEVVREEDRLAIRAGSNSTASALIYEIEYDPKRWPRLRWTWKIDQVVSRGDATNKETDDFAARVYVVFPSWAFWRTTALNYVWANRLPQGEVIANAYTENAMMIAVESGPDHVGEWVEEEVNVWEDYRRAFGKDPPKAGAVAIMTDTDNTGSQATAWYGPIWLLPEETE